VATAHADQRPEDLFGLSNQPTAKPATCRDARTLRCPRRDGAAPATVETFLSRAWLRRLPTVDADVGTVAGYGLGATRDNAGLAWNGASSLDNRWLLDGAPIDAPRYGDLGAAVPLDFLDGVRVRTAGFGARDRAALGAVIDAELREGGPTHDGEVRAWLGAGRAPTEVPRAGSEYELVVARYADLRTASAVGVVDGPIGAHGWYVAGVAPSLADHSLERRGFRLVDVGGDGAPDVDDDGALVVEPIASQRRDGLGFAAPILARAGYRTAHHALALTALGNRARSVRWLGAAEATAAGVDRDVSALTGSATWTGSWDATTVRAQASWFRSARRESPHGAGGDRPAIGTAYVPAPVAGVGDAIDRSIRAACVDDAGPSSLQRCPVGGYYWAGGAGSLVDVVQDRPTITADIEHRLGEHLLAVGVTGEDGRVVLTQRYTGGSLRQQLGEGTWVDYRLVRIGSGPGFDDDCGGVSCTILDQASTTYRTRYAAAYVADTWRPAATVAVEYGVRGESTQLGTALVLRDVLPRASASWDFVGQGRSRLFVGWGRYAQVLPTGTGERVFAGPTILQTLTFGGDQSSTLGGGGTIAVDAEARGTRVDEALIGVEVGWPDVVRLGVTVRERHLGRALEDDHGVLTGAGRNGGVAATREYTEVATWLENAPTARLGVRIGYAWSRLRGNWPGPYDPATGYNLSSSPLFDDGGDHNATGALPNDQPHRFFAELALRGGWRGLVVEGGLRASAISGRPRDARIGTAEDFAIARGSVGRLPLVSAANLHLAARRGRVTATLDVFNLFDRRAPTSVDDVYASDARPVDGGDRGDLIWLKDDFDDGPAHRNPGYGLPTRYQAPVAAVLGLAVEL